MGHIPTEGAGKGDTPRNVNKKKYDTEYDRIFGVPCGTCGGKGTELFGLRSEVDEKGTYRVGGFRPCTACNGKGRIHYDTTDSGETEQGN